MTKKAVVVSTEKEILVHSVINESCVSCTHGCEKTNIEYSVSNPKSFQIKKGDIVELSDSHLSLSLSGLVSLLFPFFCAVAGFFLSSPISSLFDVPVSDGIRAVCVLSFLAVSSLIVFIVTRIIELPGKLVIVSVN